MTRGSTTWPRNARRAGFIVVALALNGAARGAVAPPARTPQRVVSFGKGIVRVRYDLLKGTADFHWNGVKRVSGIYSAVRLQSVTLTSKDYAARTCSASGSVMVVTLTGAGKPTMRQRFVLGGGARVLVRVELAGAGLRSKWMAPIVADTAGCVDVGGKRDVRALEVPFDNDKWVRYNAASINGTGISHEAAAFFNNDTRRGLVVGSVTHDTWKTGIAYKGSGGRLDELKVYGGAADTMTHDVEPHGAVVGDRIVSPQVLVGFYADWRDGLEDFAAANASMVPALKWAGGVPFGWNSWGKLQKQLSYDKAVAVSDFVAKSLQPRGFSNDGTVTINLDSWWDNLSESQLADFPAHAHANGQKAGIYWTPFTYWGTDLARPVEGTRYTYGDIVLRDEAGKPISLNGGIALDASHPGTLERIDHTIDRFKRWSYDYVKLDFLTYGSLEGGCLNGRHYDPAVQTGIQAYNRGMARVLKRIGGSMFISASIAPLFPYRYAHARRVSCDAFGGIGETEYVMNSETYGWWTSGRLYAFNDPDHIVLEGHSANENQSRVTSAAIAGTVFLSGDDLTTRAGQALATRWLTNAAVNAVARTGQAFRPIEGNTGNKAADAMVLKHKGTYYLAVFNYDEADKVTKRLDLRRTGLDPSEVYTVTDLWSGRKWTARGIVTLRLEPAQSTLLRLDRVTGGPANELAGYTRQNPPARVQGGTTD